jgi:hypothetical protein
MARPGLVGPLLTGFLPVHSLMWVLMAGRVAYNRMAGNGRC